MAQLEVLTSAMVLIVFNSKVPSGLKLQRRKKRKLAHGRSRRRLKTNGLKINVPGSHQKCPTINRTNKTQLKVARFNWNKREIFFLFFSSPGKLAGDGKHSEMGLFPFCLQLRRGFAAHKISRSCSICRLNCQQRPEEKQRVLNNLNFIFFNGKFSICPWSLKSISFFRLSFFIACAFMREFINIFTYVVVSYQILFDELKIFIHKK